MVLLKIHLLYDEALILEIQWLLSLILLTWNWLWLSWIIWQLISLDEWQLQIGIVADLILNNNTIHVPDMGGHVDPWNVGIIALVDSIGMIDSIITTSRIVKPICRLVVLRALTLPVIFIDFQASATQWFRVTGQV